MKGNKNIISNKCTKIMLLTLLIITSILSMYLVINTNNKVFTAKIINQKATNSDEVSSIVNIPDQNFKNFLLTYFKKNKQERMLKNPSQEGNEPKTYLKLTDDDYIKPESETEIYKYEIEKITEINIGEDIDFGIKDLTGLEKAINMVRIVVTTNKREEYKIESIEPLRNLPKLNAISLKNNKITNLEPLSGMNQLYSLNFMNNKIENIEPLRGNVDLNYLYLDSNKINNIEVLSGLTTLKKLSLSRNKIENIEPIRRLTNLIAVDLSENKIENIEPLNGLTSLTYLSLFGNKIVNIEMLRGLTNLTSLSLAVNKIENIEPISGLTNLNNLYLRENKIENIEVLKGFSNLTYVSLDGNKIENIEPLKELTNLTFVSLDNNKIKNMDIVKELRNITTMYMFNEEINISPTTIKFNLPVLKKYNGEILDIVQASNGLLKKNTDGTYSFTRSVTGVQTINVGEGIYNKNPKVNTNWDYFEPIYILKIDPTNIQREVVNIPDQDLKNFLLKYFKKPDDERKNIDNNNYYLKLSNPNYIKPSDENEIYKYEMEKIIELRAENINTKETAMDLTGLEASTNLRKLNLYNNKIENIEPLKGLTSLTYLLLDGNKIENIEPLKVLTNLISLSLFNNKIENVEPLKVLTNLTSLSLFNNKIENVDPLKGLTNLTSLGLYSNKIENIEPLKELINLTILSLSSNKIENVEALKGLTKLTTLYLSSNKIENVEVLKGLTNIRTSSIFNEEINVSPNTNKFNLPVLKKYNGEILDIVQASNGLLKENSDGTYSFTRKVTGVQRVNVGKGIENKDPKVDANWNDTSPIYILKIDPTNIVDEKISIAKTVKDKSNTLLNNDKETKVVPVIKRNGQIINNANTNNVGHRANNDELLTYTWNELPKFDDTYTDYNYEVTFDISRLPEGYSIEENTKTADNQADFNITYVSPKVTVNKEITVNRWI